MQLGAIPVYISDNHLLPWSDEIDWSEFSVVVTPDNMQNILQMTLGMSASKLKTIQRNLENIWERHFSIDATCKHILKRLR
jgi:xylogalacturonan beta-1,3-xylosyltransferase